MTDLSTALTLLSSDTRRRLLLVLCDVPTVELPEDLRMRSETRTKQQTPPTSSTPTIDRGSDRLETQLRHTHLPKLANHDVIEWDRETMTVSRGTEFDSIEPLVRLLLSNPESLPSEFC